MGIPCSKCPLQNCLFLTEMDRKRSGTVMFRTLPLTVSSENFHKNVYDLFTLAKQSGPRAACLVLTNVVIIQNNMFFMHVPRSSWVGL